MADSCVELGEERSASEDADGGRTYTRVFMAIMDSANSNGYHVLRVSGMPGLLTQHPNDAGAVVVKRSPRQTSESQNHWKVTIDYGTRLNRAPMDITSSGGGGGSGGAPSEMANEDPLQRPPEFDFDIVRYEEAMEADMDGNRYVNTAGQPFEPPHVEERAHLALTITKNMASFNPQMMARHIYCVNVEPYLGYQQDEVLLDMIRAKVAWEKTAYWVVTARFVFNPIEVIRPAAPGVLEISRGGWYARKWNVGYEHLVNGELRKMVINGGSNPTRPQMLSATGTWSPTTTNPNIYLRFRPKARKSFSALGLF